MIVSQVKPLERRAIVRSSRTAASPLDRQFPPDSRGTPSNSSECPGGIAAAGAALALFRGRAVVCRHLPPCVGPFFRGTRGTRRPGGPSQVSSKKNPEKNPFPRAKPFITPQAFAGKPLAPDSRPQGPARPLGEASRCQESGITDNHPDRSPTPPDSRALPPDPCRLTPDSGLLSPASRPPSSPQSPNPPIPQSLPMLDPLVRDITSTLQSRLPPGLLAEVDRHILDRRPGAMRSVYRQLTLDAHGISQSAFYRYARRLRKRAARLDAADLAPDKADRAPARAALLLVQRLLEALTLENPSPADLERLTRACHLAVRTDALIRESADRIYSDEPDPRVEAQRQALLAEMRRQIDRLRRDHAAMQVAEAACFAELDRFTAARRPAAQGAAQPPGPPPAPPDPTAGQSKPAADSK